jgi:hypothetical protein
MIALRARTWVALAALAMLVPFGAARAGDTASKKSGPRSTATSVPVVAASPMTLGSDTAPYHGSLDNITWGGHGELRFGYDVTAGVSDPSWFSVGRVNGFMEAKLGSKLRLRGQAAYDHVPDDFTSRRSSFWRVSAATLEAHAGIFLVPLGRTNLSHDAPAYEFGERSLVATQILGVPNAQLGAECGARGRGAAPCRSRTRWTS